MGASEGQSGSGQMAKAPPIGEEEVVSPAVAEGSTGDEQPELERKRAEIRAAFWNIRRGRSFLG